MMKKGNFSTEQLNLPIIQKKIQNNQDFRIKAAKESLLLFSHIYFGHYIEYPTPDFHKDIYKEIEGEENFIELLAFRESAKSTITSLFYPIWEIINDKHNFIILCSYTGSQIKQLFQNVRVEFETNKKLIEDFGPFASDEEWTTRSVIIPKYDTKVIGKSVGQSSRGMRYKQYRPSLAVFDDIEEDEAMKTQERRDKLDSWFRSVMIPALKDDAKIILSGSLLHKDSLMKRIADEIEEGERDGKLLKYPLYKERMADNMWKERYPDKESILKKKREVGSETVWRREYLLEIVAEEGQVINWKDINWYDTIPEDEEKLRTVIAIDPAISEKDTADYTAITVFTLTTNGKSYKIYCRDYVNKRLGFEKIVDKIEDIHSKYPESIVLIEDKGYQKSIIQVMQKEPFPVKPISFKGDKRSRLEVVSPQFKKGRVYFKKNQREVTEQIVNLGIEKHDDLCDSVVYALYNLQQHLSNNSLPEKDINEEGTITSGLLNKQF